MYSNHLCTCLIHSILLEDPRFLEVGIFPFRLECVLSINHPGTLHCKMRQGNSCECSGGA